MTDKPDPAKPAMPADESTPGPTNPGGAGQTGSDFGSWETGREGAATPGPTNPGGMGQSTGFETGTGSAGGTGTGTAAGTGGGRKRMSDTARKAASDAADSARGMASEQAERAKSAVAEEVSSVAHALRTAADDLRDGSAQERTFAQIADTLADTAEAIRGKDLGQMMQEATEIARRHPMAFLGGAALLGFTAMRFAKASRDDSYRRRGAFRSAATRTPPASPSQSSAFQPGRMP